MQAPKCLFALFKFIFYNDSWIFISEIIVNIIIVNCVNFECIAFYFVIHLQCFRCTRTFNHFILKCDSWCVCDSWFLTTGLTVWIISLEPHSFLTSQFLSRSRTSNQNLIVEKDCFSVFCVGQVNPLKHHVVVRWIIIVDIG